MKQPTPFESLAETVDPTHTALLVIDVQNDLCGANCQAMLLQLKAFIRTAREAGVFVIYVQNSTTADQASVTPSEVARRRILGMRTDVTVDGTPGQDFVAAVAPHPGDPIVRKHRMNSFLGTDLKMLLRWHDIKSVVLTGVATHGCVMNTAYAAVGNDYYTVVVEDCVAAQQSRSHDLALQVLRGGIHYVVPSQAVLDAWESALTPARPHAAATA
jgi:nicotinamidase-related amidase